MDIRKAGTQVTVGPGGERQAARAAENLRRQGHAMQADYTEERDGRTVMRVFHYRSCAACQAAMKN